MSDRTPANLLPGLTRPGISTLEARTSAPFPFNSLPSELRQTVYDGFFALHPYALKIVCSESSRRNVRRVVDTHTLHKALQIGSLLRNELLCAYYRRASLRIQCRWEAYYHFIRPEWWSSFARYQGTFLDGRRYRSWELVQREGTSQPRDAEGDVNMDYLRWRLQRQFHRPGLQEWQNFLSEKRISVDDTFELQSTLEILDRIREMSEEFGKLRRIHITIADRYVQLMYQGPGKPLAFSPGHRPSSGQELMERLRMTRSNSFSKPVVSGS